MEKDEEDAAQAIVEAIWALLKPWYVDGEELVDAHGTLESIAEAVGLGAES